MVISCRSYHLLSVSEARFTSPSSSYLTVSSCAEFVHRVHTSCYWVCLCCVVWYSIRSGDSQRLERLQRSAARLIAGVSVWHRLPYEILLARAGLDHLFLRRRTACVEFAFRLLHSSPDKPLIPSHLASAYMSWKALTPSSSSALVLRSSSPGTQRLPRPRTKILRRSPFYHCVQLLHDIPAAQSTTLSSSLLSSFMCLISLSLCQ